MIIISDAERKAILKKYPNAWIVRTRHHAMLSGYDTSYAMNYLRELRGEKPIQKTKSNRKDGRQPRRG